MKWHTCEIREQFHLRFVQIQTIRTHVKLFPNFTRHHLITHTNFMFDVVCFLVSDFIFLNQFLG